MHTRTSQGTIAWLMVLSFLPVFGIPLFFIFGRRRFSGYKHLRKRHSKTIYELAAKQYQTIKTTTKQTVYPQKYTIFAALAKMPFTFENKATLLIDGVEIFRAIFKGIKNAEHSILLEFFIIRHDKLGKALAKALIQARKRGVKVYFLYDAVGSYALIRNFRDTLTENGIEFFPFFSSTKKNNLIQTNFRNHRKLVLIDGHTAYIGGANVGVEYLGKGKKFTQWRDTFVSLTGPSVLNAQISFTEDWHWATKKLLSLPLPSNYENTDSASALILPSSPADDLETCNLFFIDAITQAKKRVWIASPYFIPDSAIVSALQLAALKGVDVRILLPDNIDHKLVYASSFAYLNETISTGVKIYRYKTGFMHQKVMLVDDDCSFIGSANLDNRSFRLNFELTAIILGKDFAQKTEQMLEKDFTLSRLVRAEEYTERNIFFKLMVRIARLLAPIL